MNLKLSSLLKQLTGEVECERKFREVLQFLVEVLSVSFKYFYLSFQAVVFILYFLCYAYIILSV